MRPLFAFIGVFAVAWTAALFPQSVEVNPSAAPPADTLSVVSLNLAMESDAQRILADISRSSRLKSADVFLLQEVVNPGGGLSAAESLAGELGYYVAFSPAGPEIYNQGLAVVSRYPLSGTSTRRLKDNDVWFHTRKRFVLSSNVATPWGDLRVWDVHLDNRINRGARVTQLTPVIEDAAQYEGPRIIGGDFNTNDFYWVWHLLPFPTPGSHVSAVRRTMQQHGFETPFADSVITHPTVGRHLDWIFVDQMKPVESGVEPVPFSDHRAIWANLQVE
jgi:endonuclease/exonuclease/phosphatase family metal-dependent hydrolase